MLYWPVFFKRNNVKFWLNAIDKHAIPTTVGKFPPNATDDEINKLLQAIAAIRSASGVAIPEGMSLDLLTAAAAAAGAGQEKLYAAMDKAIAKVINSQTMTQAATVVPMAAPRKPMAQAMPMATTALTTMATRANRNGVRVSSRAK